MPISEGSHVRHSAGPNTVNTISAPRGTAQGAQKVFVPCPPLPEMPSCPFLPPPSVTRPAAKSSQAAAHCGPGGGGAVTLGNHLAAGQSVAPG